MPDYVGEIQLARYIGVPVDELDAWPAHRIEQYAVVRAAEIAAQNARARTQG